MRRSKGILFLWWLAVASCVPVEASRADDGLAGAALLSALREGGYVIYFRHADTGPATPDPPGVDLQRCETQRNLNDNGRMEARAIGAAFKALRIPVGRVLTSAFCRCRETAALAFGSYQVAPTLTVVPRGPQFAAARETAAARLRSLLSTQPESGTNTVLVAHGFNLIDLDGLYLSTQGEAAVYRPLRGDMYRLVARVLPAQWAELGSVSGGAGAGAQPR